MCVSLVGFATLRCTPPEITSPWVYCLSGSSTVMWKSVILRFLEANGEAEARRDRMRRGRSLACCSMLLRREREPPMQHPVRVGVDGRMVQQMHAHALASCNQIALQSATATSSIAKPVRSSDSECGRVGAEGQNRAAACLEYIAVSRGGYNGCWTAWTTIHEAQSQRGQEQGRRRHCVAVRRCTTRKTTALLEDRCDRCAVVCVPPPASAEVPPHPSPVIHFIRHYHMR